MKKFIILFLIIITIAACKKNGEKNLNSQQNKSIQNNSAEVEKIATNSLATEKSENIASKTINGSCPIDEAKLQNDSELKNLYERLETLQEDADEMAKYPKSLHILKSITENIGEVKGLIEYRSLQLAAEYK